MKKTVKSAFCVILSLAFVFSFSGCSANIEMTEENVKATVEKAVEALKEFNTDDINDYIDSKTLSYIVDLAEDHEQFGELGKAMFANLSIQIDDIDLENSTVSVTVKNNHLFAIASDFAYELNRDYSTFELVSLLDDEYFLDSSLNTLTKKINEESYPAEAKQTILTIKEGKKNLVVSVDEDAENVISGGALSGVMQVFGF